MKNDKNVLKNTTFTTNWTYIGYVTEKAEEYEQLTSQHEHYQHIVFSDRNNIPDMRKANQTLKLGQVESREDASEANRYRFCTAFIPCRCLMCREIGSSDSCLF